MCIKIFPKVSSGMHNSYSVTKVLLKHSKVLVSVNSLTSCVTRHGLMLLSRNYTEMGVQTDVRQNTTTGDERLGTTKSSNVNNKPKVSKERLSKDVLEYLNSKDSLKSVLCHLPQKLLKRKAKPDALYTVDQDVASKCTYYGRVL
jgi:hypothetical protein